MFLRIISLVSLVVTAGACSDENTGSGEPGSGGDGAGGSTLSGRGGSGGVDDSFGLPIGGRDGGSDGGDACGSVLQVVYRDFKETHPDFEMDFRGDGVRRHLLKPELDGSSKPQFLDSLGCPPELATPLDCRSGTASPLVINSKETFDQWYRDVDGVNIAFARELPLAESAPGSGQYVFDSTAFFPLSRQEGFGSTPPGRDQNFLFTTEIHLKFGYVAGQKFSFRGDDDLWIFVNNKLALDLGSMHGPEAGVIDFDAQAGALGIVAGGVYPMDIFHAERHTDGSNFHVETNISCFTSVDVPR